MAAPSWQPERDAPGPVTGPASTAEVHIADVVIAKIAAYYALNTPGVVELRPGGGRSALKTASQLIRARTSDDRLGHLPAEEVQVHVHRPTATVDIELDVVIQLDYPCLDVAKALQQHVDAHVQANTGLASTVTVNIVDIELGDSTTL